MFFMLYSFLSFVEINNAVVVSACMVFTQDPMSQSRWARRLRRVSAAARFQGWLVRFLPVARMFVLNVVCFQVEVKSTGRSLDQRSPTDYVSSAISATFIVYSYNV
jgi:hypothetical protein